jgi:hypothetical protein
MKVVENHSGGLFLFQFFRPKCNQIKGWQFIGPDSGVEP